MNMDLALLEWCNMIGITYDSLTDENMKVFFKWHGHVHTIRSEINKRIDQRVKQYEERMRA